MGIYDRDWYRDRHKAAPRSPRTAGAAARRSTSAPTGWGRWLLWAGLIVGGLLLTRYLVEVRKDLPFPRTGQVHWYISKATNAVATLTITAPNNTTASFVVQLDDWETKAPIAMIPVRGGETARLQMPLGRYRLTMIKGSGWRGPGRNFRHTISAKESIHPLELYRDQNQTFGHNIQLETVRGNMETKPVWR